MIYEWAENLPDQCPPPNAIPPMGDYFRVASAYPPSAGDFLSARLQNPEKVFGIDECLVRSCSIFSKYSEIEKLLKLPRHRNKTIVKLTLSAKSGLVLRTFDRPGHYSWWRDRRFSVIEYAEKAEVIA